jgi:hypothetical protein
VNLVWKKARTLTTRIPLRNLDLNPQHIRLQLQHLILDLPILERCSSGGFCSAGCGDGVVEAACGGFGGFGEFGGRGDDGEIRGGDTG